MSTWKRMTAAVLAVGLAGTLVAGCAGSKTTDAPKDTNTQTAAPAQKDVEVVFWEQQEDADKFFGPVIDKFMAANPHIKVTRVHYETEKLRENFLTAVQGGQGPAVLFGPDDQTGVFATAGVVQPLDNFFSAGYLDGINKAALAGSKMDGKLWGVPAWIGNQLMLIYNKKLVPTPPANTDDLAKMAADLKAKGVQYTLAFNQTEPFFFVPWLAGFGGKVFDDKNNPTLNTPAMVDSYKLIMNWKNQGIVPKESDYDGAEALFKDGKAAMIINGPWALSGYTDAKVDWGIAKIPQVSGKGWPQPYTSTKAYYVSKTVTDPDLKAAVKTFIEYMTSEDTEKALFAMHKETPANIKAAASDVVKTDAILAAQQTQLEQVTPMPNIVQMRYVWDSWKPEMQLVFSGQKSPEDAAKASQTQAEKLIKENK